LNDGHPQISQIGQIASTSVLRRKLACIKAIVKKRESRIQVLAAQWALQSEFAFPKGLRAILKKSFWVQLELNSNVRF